MISFKIQCNFLRFHWFCGTGLRLAEQREYLIDGNVQVYSTGRSSDDILGPRTPWPSAAKVTAGWKAIIYERFRQKFLACQSHPPVLVRLNFSEKTRRIFLRPVSISGNRLALPRSRTLRIMRKVKVIVATANWFWIHKDGTLFSNWIQMIPWFGKYCSFRERQSIKEGTESEGEQASLILCGVVGGNGIRRCLF